MLTIIANIIRLSIIIASIFNSPFVTFHMSFAPLRFPSCLL